MNEIIFWTGIWTDGISRPIGVYQLASWLRKNSIECQVIDFCQWFSAEEIVELTVKFIGCKTKYIGISSGFWSDESFPANIESAINILKKEYPHIKIIVGGQRSDTEKIKNNSDIVIVGEAENQLLSLIKGHNLSKLFDITTLEHRFSQEDCIIEGEVLPIELGRGCIFKCKFCGHHNLGKPKHTYQRNIGLIEQEIIYNYENFKTTHYHFLDDTVNEDLDKIKNLSNIPKNTGIDIKWNGYLRADLLWRYSESPSLLFESGMRGCFLGIESLHPYASKTIGKGWSGKHAKDFLPILYNDIWKKEINIWCNFIVGLPGESIEDLNNTLEWCLENPIGYHKFVTLNLYNSRTDTHSKSEFAKNFKKYGYIIQSGKWHNGFFDSIEADDLCRNYNQKLSSVNRLSSWTLFDLVNCGIDIEKGKQMSSSYNKLLRLNFKSFLNNYKDKLSSL